MASDLKGIKEIIPNEKYDIRATTGNRKRETFHGSLIDAIKRKKELGKTKPKEEQSKETKKVIPNLSFEQAIELFIEDRLKKVEIEKMDINSVYDHIKKFDNYILPFFKNYYISNIDTSKVEEFADYLRAKPHQKDPNKTLSETTVSNVFKTLNALFNYCKAKKWIEDNPVSDAMNKPSTTRKKPELKYFKIEEAIYALKCLEKFADIRLKAFMFIIFSLGCRREECGGIRWCDIDFETGEVNYQFAITSQAPPRLSNSGRVRKKKLKTPNSYRTNILSKKAIKYLKEYYTFKKACGYEIKEDDFIFTSWNKDEVIDPNKLTNHWLKFKRCYNIKDVDLHRIRHTVANILERKGIPKKDIAQMLGNTERVLQEYYTHVDYDEMYKMRDTLDEELSEDMDCVKLNIDFVIKIINEYPMSSFEEEQLMVLDSLVDEKVTDLNFERNLKLVKDLIITDEPKMSFFLDYDNDRLNVKIETYKMFSSKRDIKVKKQKDLYIGMDVFSI